MYFRRKSNFLHQRAIGAHTAKRFESQWINNIRLSAALGDRDPVDSVEHQLGIF